MCATFKQFVFYNRTITTTRAKELQRPHRSTAGTQFKRLQLRIAI